MIETPTVTVAIAGICSSEHIGRCLDALAAQVDAPDFDVVVVYDPEIGNVAGLETRHPRCRIMSREGQRTPVQLAAGAVAEATGDLILLTEDHCVPRPDWVRIMVDARADDRAVVGGRVEIAAGATATDWAFYFVDFFRYAAPVREGRAGSLSVCNAMYRREQLQAVRDVWEARLHETAVHLALQEHFGCLWLEPRSEVTMGRHVALSAAIYERYAFGRLFGCARNSFVTARRRMIYAILAPTLPLLIGGRLARKALSNSRLASSFAAALIPLSLMVSAWSWGELLGYVTGTHPRSLVVAQELGGAEPAGG